MKNLFKMSLLAFILATGVACEEDDKTSNTTPNKPTDKSVEGEWELTKYDQDGESKVNGATANTYTATGSNFAGSINFKPDNTFTSDVSYDATFKFTIPGAGTQTFTQSLSGFESKGDWKVNANGDLEFTVTDSTNTVQTTTMEIANHTANELILKFSESSSQTDTASGMTMITTANGQITLQRK